jgi:hypothetical protein
MKGILLRCKCRFNGGSINCVENIGAETSQTGAI